MDTSNDGVEDFRKRAKDGNLNPMEADVVITLLALERGATSEVQFLGREGSISEAYRAFTRIIGRYTDLEIEISRHRDKAGRSAPGARGGQQP